MFSLATKAMFGLAAVTLVSAVVYMAAVNDDAGMMLLFSASVVAVIAGLAFGGSGAADRDAAPTAEPAAPTTDPSGPSPWPILTALALTVVAVGLATGTVLIVGGLVVLAIMLAGWLGHSWAEHPTWSAENGAWVSERLISPVGVPVGVFALVAVIVISFSRVLLAVPSANAATAVALVAAILILGACTFVALRPNLGPSAVIALAAIAGVMTVGAGITSAVAGERPVHHEAEHADDADHEDGDHEEDGEHEAEPGDAAGGVELSAKNLQFDKKELEVAAGEAFEIVFENEEALPHNVSVLDEDKKPLVKGEIITGPKKTVHMKVPALDEGEYAFRCDVHPTMAGVVVAS